MSTLLESYVESYDVDALYKYLRSYKKTKVDGKEMVRIIKSCFHLGHIDGPVVVQLLIEFGIAKPNKKIKGSKYNWAEVCIRNRLKDCLDLLVFCGEKRSGLSEDKITAIRKKKKSELFKYNVESKDLKKSDFVLKKNSKWITWFEDKFAMARKKFKSSDEIAMFVNEDKGSISILYQVGTFFTPLAGKEFFYSLPLDDETRETGCEYRDVSFMVLDDLHLTESLKVDFCILVERENQKEVEKDELLPIPITEEEPVKPKKGLFGGMFQSATSKSEWLESKTSFFFVPQFVRDWLQKKASEVEDIDVDNMEIVDPKKMKEKGTVKIEGGKVKGAKTIVCFKTKKIIYAHLLNAPDPYLLRSFANYVDQIMEKVLKKGM